MFQGLKRIFQALKCTFQALGCTFQSLGYKKLRELSRISTQCPDISIGNAKGEEANQIGSLYTRDRIGSTSRQSLYARSAKESAYCQGESTFCQYKKEKRILP